MEYISTEEQRLISDILTRFLQCTRNGEVYSYNLENPFEDIHLQKNFKCIDCVGDENRKCLKEQIICIYDNKELKTQSIIDKYKENNYLIILHEEMTNPIRTEGNKGLVRKISFDGLARFKETVFTNDKFKVLAIIHVYNEEDVIRKTTEYLLSQGIDVYLIDNWSSDSSYAIIQDLHGRYEGRVFSERFPAEGPNDYYDWYHQLQRSEELSCHLDYDWYIHYDADEYRVSPWKGVSLKDAIYYIDSLGYNLIDNTVIDFKITDIDDESIFMKDTWFDFGHRTAHFEQTKTWKKCEEVDLKSTGGHIAKVKKPKVFPLKILNRHYPLRSLSHAQKKIFAERKPRFAKEKQERGWHGHYDGVIDANDLVSNAEGLIKWNQDTFDSLYMQLFTGVGIKIYEDFSRIDNKVYELDSNNGKISIYGAGKAGQLIYKSISDKYDVLHWVDKNYERIAPRQGRIIESPEVLCTDEGIIWIAVEKESVAHEIEGELVQRGINQERIIWKDLKK